MCAVVVVVCSVCDRPAGTDEGANCFARSTDAGHLLAKLDAGLIGKQMEKKTI